MADLQKVETLKGPPVKGRTYLVQCAHAEFAGLKDWWPVHPGPMVDNFNGNDTKLENSPPHYHLDPRFFSNTQRKSASAMWADFCDKVPDEGKAVLRQSRNPAWMCAAMSYAIATHPIFRPEESTVDAVEHRPLICRLPIYEWDVPARDRHWNVKPITGKGDNIPAIVSKGRPRCPHNGMDLSGFWDGKSDAVRCPLHGLEVDMRKVPSRG